MSWTSWLTALRARFGGGSQHRAYRNTPTQRCRPGLETLEDCCVPTVALTDATENNFNFYPTMRSSSQESHVSQVLGSRVLIVGALLCLAVSHFLAYRIGTNPQDLHPVQGQPTSQGDVPIPAKISQHAASMSVEEILEEYGWPINVSEDGAQWDYHWRTFDAQTGRLACRVWMRVHLANGRSVAAEVWSVSGGAELDGFPPF
jgi:hypothetical protein